MKIERTFTFEVDEQAWAIEFGCAPGRELDDFGSYLDEHAVPALLYGLGTVARVQGKVTRADRSPVIYRIERADLEILLRHLGLEDKPRPGEEKGFVPIRTLRICVDGGVKVKVNELGWSPPLGEDVATVNTVTVSTTTGDITHIVVMHLDQTHKRTRCGRTRVGHVRRLPLSAVNCTTCAKEASSRG